MRMTVVVVALLLLPALSSVGASDETAAPEVGSAFEPHVVVAVPDSGINPYHSTFYRPERTEHPCTYVEDFPCDIPALNLTIGTDLDYRGAVAADADEWDRVVPGTWFWIPKTVFIAVHCDKPYSSPSFQSSRCLLDEHGHGTGTSSSVLTENPDALLAFLGGSFDTEQFFTRGIPVDIFSVSWGHTAPVPLPFGTCFSGDGAFSSNPVRPIFVKAAGNEGVSTLADCWSGNPRLISVGGGHAGDRTQHPFAYKEPDIVSYFCRPAAVHDATSGWRLLCGTSFSAPTAAGGLSKVILALRRDSGYTGGIQGDFVDPVRGTTIRDLRDAMNRTASYTPQSQYSEGGYAGIPVTHAAPWLHWGWGFYDGRVAQRTVLYLLGTHWISDKPALAKAYMEALYAGRTALYGSGPVQSSMSQDDAGSGRDAGDIRGAAVSISPGSVYQGAFGIGDSYDWYTFWAEAGDLLYFRARAVWAGIEVFDPDGQGIGSSVSYVGVDAVRGSPTRVEIEQTGWHYLEMRSPLPSTYRFIVTTNESPQEPGYLGYPLPPPA